MSENDNFWQPPDWFIQNCVKTQSEVNNLAARISIQQRAQCSVDADADPSSAEHSTGVYEVYPYVYERLLDVAMDRKQCDGAVFVDHVINLWLPNELHPAIDFFTSTVASIAKHVGADMVVLNSDDVEDLAEHIVLQKDPNHRPLATYENYLTLLPVMPEEPVASNDEPKTPDDERVDTTDKRYSALTNAILSSRRIKSMQRGGDQSTAIGDTAESSSPAETERPIIVLIHQWTKPAPGFGSSGNPYTFLNGFLDSLRSVPQTKGRLLAIGTSSSSTYSLAQHMREFTAPENLTCFPAKSQVQRDLFRQEKSLVCQRLSIRYLQRALRRFCRDRNRSQPDFLQPHAEWEIPIDGAVPEILKGLNVQDHTEAFRIAQQVMSRKDLTLENLFVALTELSQEEEMLRQWQEKEAPKVEEKTLLPDFPPRVQQVVDRVINEYKSRSKDSQDDFSPEKEILLTLVNPNTINGGWSDIEVEPEVKSRIRRLIFLMERRSQLSGILKSSAMGGVLLYGPPGTGKTCLARVIAKESSSVMLRVSAAEIGQKWVGQTEKVIQTLFKLARELYPCIIFIDEADSLFRQRQGSDRSWERSHTNQLLGEFGGFNKDATSPLVLLATNFPQDLDPAVLRRVPNKIFLGLPSTKARQGILNIHLREEMLDSTVDIEQLAKNTEGYTGSDLEHVCQQVALLALDELGDDGLVSQEGGISLNMSHFSRVLKSASPSTSREALLGILKFAAEFDTATVKNLSEVNYPVCNQQRVRKETSEETGPQKSVASKMREARDKGLTVIE
ncbi:ATPase family AAA domain-containing 1-A [Fusarium albosuccineum]|uniref:ATPase family AAA domain-containing 1-A n=1 Tax=Fusarium albosuccineum TaxID=1237068 RepID=A0A8H4PL51_9HYPO|nr:ATPase family AAA domain-containing 1-A [Fusarium albosuccineum]